MVISKGILPKVITLIVVCIAIALTWWAWAYYTRAPWTRDARVSADVITIAAEVPGKITQLPIHDNQFVKQGDLLFEIDPERYQLAVLHAKRAVTVAQADLGQAHSAIVADEAQLKQRQSEAARRRVLKAVAAISNEDVEKADTDVLLAQADLIKVKSNLQLAEANVQLAEAAQLQAELDLKRTEVRAPVSGYVTNLLTRQGNFANTGAALLALVDSHSFYVNGYLEETKLSRVAVGKVVHVTLMSGEKFTGHVESIAYAITDRDNSAGSQLLANVNPTYTWIKLAQRIPVRIKIDPEYVKKGTLRAGMTATISIDD